ncbi:ComEC/Rec2 family competence protein [Clostridium paraputrificum]|uniref:ComEC/Rec2 family competence protein n=1 Tax=Clostridium TaxID=1485 RepID=UPI003D328826
MKKKISILALIVCFFTVFLTGCTNTTPPVGDTKGEMKVHYINVGQGDSMLVQVNDKNMLIDCGPRSGKDELFNYLNELNIKKLDYVIATHPHEDHIGNMGDVVRKYEIGAFYAPKVEHTTKTFENMIEALQKKNLKINTIKAGTDSIDLGQGTRVSIFSPVKDEYKEGSKPDFNNYSPIMKIEFGSNSFLFTGDAEKEVESEVLANKSDVKADVLKFGHHGSSTSTSEEFFKAVNPSIGVISLAADNSYGHPHKETLKTIKDNNLTVYRTDKDGDIVLVSDGTTIKKK